MERGRTGKAAAGSVDTGARARRTSRTTALPPRSAGKSVAHGRVFGLEITTLEPIGGNLGIGEMRDLGNADPVALSERRNGVFGSKTVQKKPKKQPERRPWGETALGDHFALGASRRRTRSRGGAFSLTLSTLALRALALLGTLGV